MTREELFQAIGAVEESRLARIEWSMSLAGNQEDRNRKPTRIIRNLFIAAVMVSMLAVTAYAVGGWLIYDTPEEMLASIFGDKTGYDHGEYTEISDPERPDSLLAVQPEFDRVEADEEVVAEDIAPYVSPVGQSIEYQGMVLTVDAFVYDSATQCGIVTYTLENGPGYNLQTTGEIWYEGIPDPANFSQYGYSYIIQDKTTDSTLAAAYYFRYDSQWDEEGFSVGLRQERSYEERMQERSDIMAEVKAQYTPEEAVAAASEKLQQQKKENPELDIDLSGNWLQEGEAAYEVLRDLRIVERAVRETESLERIVFDCAESRELKHLSLAAGSITVSPISMEVDIADMEFLHTDIHGNHRVSTDNLDEIRIRFRDDSVYLVRGGDASNTLFAVSHTADGTMGSDYSIGTYMFNRVVDIDAIDAVILNGREFTAE